MAEPTFTRPLVNWLEKRRAKKAAEQQRTEGADQLAAVRDIFSLSTPTTGSEPVPEETTQEEIPAETASLRDIFGPSAPAGREVVHEETPQETFTGTASFRDIFGPSSPMETENAPEPVVQQASADVTAEVGQLPRDLIENVFTRSAAIPDGAEVEDPEAEEPKPRPITRVSIDTSTEEETAEEPRTQVVSGMGDKQGQGSETQTDEKPGPPTGSFRDIFRRKAVTNPHVKALLRRHDAVDVHELADELQDFARSIGASGY